MSVGLSVVAFVIGAIVSLATSWVLVSRLERVGERFGLSEALLGMVAALAADAPEITASVTALAHHQATVGAGVVLGSNVFNLAALLGLGAVAAGSIGLHRKVVVFSGTVAMAVGAVCLLSVGGQLAAGAGLALVLAVLVPFVALLGAHRQILGRLKLPERWTAWITAAIVEEERELEEAIHPRRGTAGDAWTAGGALVVVVVASVAMEGERPRWVCTSAFPRSSWAVWSSPLSPACPTRSPRSTWPDGAGRGHVEHGAQLQLSQRDGGPLDPRHGDRSGRPSGSGLLVAGWYVGLTALTLVLAYAGHGLRRPAGGLIIVAYAPS